MPILRNIQQWPAHFYTEGVSGEPELFLTCHKTKITILRKNLGQCTLYRIVKDIDLPLNCFVKSKKAIRKSNKKK